jgi:ferritin
MLKEKVEKGLNSQLNAELYSSYLYLSMSAYCKTLNLDGFANWLNVQAQEELVHAMKFYDFIIQRGGNVRLTRIEGPPTEWDSPRAVFENVYEHERKVTALIDDLVDLALEQRDHATNIFLQWFVTEQVEEEENASGVLEKVKQVEGTRGGLFMLDRELGSRAPIVSAPASE